MAKHITAQTTFTATLWSDGTVHINESGMYRADYLSKSVYYSEEHETEGVCDVEELAYRLWYEMEHHV
uniref:Uncharacterized protein n=1 Tax=uncultured prokaryote TaxID=198431 RepID=A0A0H5QJ48_9ZZZZ|nr:hypothetical protein [uncultured prokaryote]